MILVSLGRVFLASACILILSLLIYDVRRELDAHRRGTQYNPLHELRHDLITRWLKLKYWWWRGYYLTIRDRPVTPDDVNLCASWSLIHGGLIGLILVIILSWFSLGD